MYACLLSIVLPLATAISPQEPDFIREQQPLQKHRMDSYSNPLERKDFEDYVNDVLDEFHTPGLAIAIVHKNNTWSKGFGYSHLESKTPFTPRTLSFAGSTTKSFTAASVAKLVYSDEETYKDITWQSKLASLIREDFVLEDEYTTNHVNFVDALSHRTGMPRHDLTWLNRGNVSTREQVRLMRRVPLQRELREAMEYCNLMFAAVGHALETVTGTALGTLFQEWFWRPLGMKETVFSLPEALELEKQSNGEIKVARAYLWDYNEGGGGGYHEVPYSDVPPGHGAGGIISNVLDYTNWVRSFLAPSDSNPITPKIAKDMTAAHMIQPVPDWEPYTTNTYGLGLEKMTYRGQTMVGHTGGIVGYMASMFWLPEHEWGVVMLQNSYSFAYSVLNFKLMDDFFDSQGIPGKHFDMASAARKVQENKAKQLRPENARKKLYPDAPDKPLLGPSLPLSAYEGTYSHPAYHEMTLKLASSLDGGLSDAPLQLKAKGEEGGYLDLSWILYHVNGENWWGHKRSGPGGWVDDEIGRAKFEIGVDGKVAALWYQAEPEMDELARFVKLK